MTTVAPNPDQQTAAGGAPPRTGAGITTGGGLASAQSQAREAAGTGGGGASGAGAGPGPARRRRGPLRLIRRSWDALWRSSEERELRARRHALSDRQTVDL